MAIEERTRAYETLIRHNVDGSIGAHHIKINEVIKDGAVIAANVGEAESVAGEGLRAVLGEAAQAALVQVEQSAATIAAQQREIDQLRQAVDSAEQVKKQLEETREQLAQAEQRVAVLDRALESADELDKARTRELEALRAQLSTQA